MMRCWVYSVFVLLSAILHCCYSEEDFLDEKYGVRYASKCEACKIVADELQLQLSKTGKSHDVVQTGYHMDKQKISTKYHISELRLIEVLEEVCEGILSYSIHKERQDSTRFSKGMSQTFQALHGLVDKGVKVDLGMPVELWDKPNAEITDLKTKCDSLIEEFEDVISQWYFKLQTDVPLHSYLCTEHVLPPGDDQCLEDGATIKKPARGDEL